MGYLGEEGMYVCQEILKLAYADSGLALDFYRSYNTTHHNPKQYFANLADVDIAELQRRFTIGGSQIPPL